MLSVYPSKVIPFLAPKGKIKTLNSIFFCLALLIAYPTFSQESQNGNQNNLLTLPVSFITFNAKLKEKKVILNWETITERNFSHYVVERSLNGSQYYEIGLVIANGNTEHKTDYEFIDKIGNKGNAIIYYRLRMTDVDGRSKNTPTKLIRLTEKEQTTSISAFPNPFSDQLRVTIPEAWQNKKVCFDIYNANGFIIKHVINDKAGQTEVIPVQDITSGLYFVKASMGSENLMHRILKSK
jgi:hypothetical protein